MEASEQDTTVVSQNTNELAHETLPTARDASRTAFAMNAV
jgi:hypothetical protein